ncbi:MAG: sialate O-acetylesterase [Acetivibrionales bacterium]|jgi:sialate O-acetylesterase
MSVELPRLISDGMVLQRNAAARLWGKADEPVTVTLLGRQYRTVPDENGRWEIVLDGLEPGGPHELTINDITIHEVFIGDVWLCSGQSNMQMPMQRVKHMYPEEIHAPNLNIRQFTVPYRHEFKMPLDSLDGGCWLCASPRTINDFSAVGYFFAKRLQERYEIPVGLILSAYGGTPIHAWMSRGMLESFPGLLLEADRYADGRYMEKVQAENEKNKEKFFSEIDEKDPGLAEKWHMPDYDDSGWEERDLLLPWTGGGSVWLRRTIDVPPEIAGKPATLFLGTITDWDMAYVNGKAVGNTTYRYPPREYAVPSMPYGRCVIAVRVISKDGGWFTPGKQYLLTTDSGSFDLGGTWRFRRGARVAPAVPETFLHCKPTSLYNGMLAPLKRYTIKGAIWYQGESDGKNPEGYAEKFTALVKGWRTDWGYEFPFLFVELAHCAEGAGWDLIRRQQRQVLGIPRTAMAAAFDLGEENDPHPLGKQAIGDRLARCAMRVVYGETMPHSPFEVVGVWDKARSFGCQV